MESKLSQISSLSQKDKGPAFIALASEILSSSGPNVARDLQTLVATVVNQESVGLVVGRQVLSELVKSLGEGAIQDAGVRKRVVEDTLQTIQPRIVSYEEQVCVHCLHYMHSTVNQFQIYLGELPEISACRSGGGGGGMERCSSRPYGHFT